MTRIKTTMYLVLVLLLQPEPLLASKSQCEEWCGNHSPPCEKCMRTSGCGAGYDVLFRARSGANWYACGKNQAGRTCDAWCRANHDSCAFCSMNAGCGPGYTQIDRFEQRGGKDWFSCREWASDRGDASERNRAACETWCNANRPCAKCDTNAGCGTGFEAMRSSFNEHPGANWHACVRKSVSCCPTITSFEANRTASNRANIEAVITWRYNGNETWAQCNGRSTSGQNGPLISYSHSPPSDQQWNATGTAITIRDTDQRVGSETNRFHLRVPAGGDENNCPHCTSEARCVAAEIFLD